MRSTLLALILTAIFNQFLMAQEISDEFPLKNEIVYIEKASPLFPNKKDLCSYYTGLLLVETNGKITTELLGKGVKWFSATRYSWIGPATYSNKCNSGQPDTLTGVFTLIMSSSKPFNVIDKFKNDVPINAFKVNYKIILKENTYDLKFRGIVVMGSKNGKAIETPLEAVYLPYIEGGKKNKALKQLFRDINGICDLFHNTLAQQMDYKIKTSELD